MCVYYVIGQNYSQVWWTGFSDGLVKRGRERAHSIRRCFFSTKVISPVTRKGKGVRPGSDSHASTCTCEMNCSIILKRKRNLPPFKPLNINNNTACSKCVNLFVDNSVLTVRQNGHAWSRMVTWTFNGHFMAQLLNSCFDCQWLAKGYGMILMSCTWCLDIGFKKASAKWAFQWTCHDCQGINGSVPWACCKADWATVRWHVALAVHTRRYRPWWTETPSTTLTDLDQGGQESPLQGRTGRWS